ncbi:hypothetical protein C2E23DRAFT_717898, partial [Lenzites betulinus]
SLVPGETPGTDSIRQAADFPKINFWKERTWTNHVKSLRGTIRIGDTVGQRGKGRSAKGINVACLYLEEVDGTPVDGYYIRGARRWAAGFIKYLQKHNIGGTSWTEIDISARETFIRGLRQKFPEFQACEDNWKGHAFMSDLYYERAVRKGHTTTQKLKPTVSDLEDAKYSLQSTRSPSPIDALDAPSKAPTALHDAAPPSVNIATPSVVTALEPNINRTRARSPTDEHEAGPSKRPNLDNSRINMDVDGDGDAGMVDLPPDVRAKGKGRAFAYTKV